MVGPESHHTQVFSFLRFFDVDHFLSIFIEFVTILLLFHILVLLGCEARGIFAPRAGMELTPPALEGEVSTSGLPGKCPLLYF